MKRLRHLVGSLALVASAYAAQAETGKHVLRILVVDVQANPSAYVKQVERGKPILKRLGVEGEIRVWQATYAGKDTGMVIVTFEFADGAAFARSEAAFGRAAGDAEYDAWVKDLLAVRKITSDILFEELDAHLQK